MVKGANNKFILFYYGILLLVLAFRTSESMPNIMVRLIYLVLFFAPIITKYKYLFLPTLICFFTVGTYGFAYSYFPYMMWVYCIISLLAFIISTNDISYIKVSPLVIFIILYVSCVNLVSSGNIQDLGYSIMTTSISSLIIGPNIRQNKALLLNAFSIISITLSIIYLINYESIIETYNVIDEVERSGWTDPNYFSCVIGMGVISSLVQLMIDDNRDKILRACRIIVVVISFIVQLLLASRGGLLSTLIAASVIFIYSKINSKYKVLILFSTVILCVLLYLNGYFDLLIYRVENDTDGSGRLVIWHNKLLAFGRDCNILQWFFGVGYEASFQLASTGKGVGFHNDFLAVLCNYGLVGFAIFIYMLFVYPIKYMTRVSRPVVLALVVYLALSCMTLEPISAGRITYIVFFYLILLCAKDRRII